MKNYEKLFEDYDVPERIKRATIAIIRRFTITGICDGKYIANVIANMTGNGDGGGNFTGDITEVGEEVADALAYAYGSNITQGEKDELLYILNHGDMDYADAKEGIRAFIKRLTIEKRGAGAWRRDYLDKVIAEAKVTLAEIAA